MIVKHLMVGVMRSGDLDFAKTKHLAQRWHVDRTSIPGILAAHGVQRSAIHKTPRYRWRDVLQKVEGIPAEVLMDKDALKSVLSEGLLTTAQLADTLGVSSQTVRNYVNSGLVRPVRLAAHTPRFHMFELCEKENEVKTEAAGQN